MEGELFTISRETDYACRVVLYLALNPATSRVTAQEIAQHQIIPRTLVRRVITRLAKAKLIKTIRGSGGGFVLSRKPAKISMLDVVEAMEGPLALNACLKDDFHCPLVLRCSVHEMWNQTQKMLMDVLAQATFDKLAARGTKPAR